MFVMYLWFLTQFQCKGRYIQWSSSGRNISTDKTFTSVLVKEASLSPLEGKREKSFEGQPLAWLSSVLDP